MPDNIELNDEEEAALDAVWAKVDAYVSENGEENKSEPSEDVRGELKGKYEKD